MKHTENTKKNRKDPPEL